MCIILDWISPCDTSRENKAAIRGNFIAAGFYSSEMQIVFLVLTFGLRIFMNQISDDFK